MDVCNGNGAGHDDESIQKYGLAAISLISMRQLCIFHYIVLVVMPAPGADHMCCLQPLKRCHCP